MHYYWIHWWIIALSATGHDITIFLVYTKQILEHLSKLGSVENHTCIRCKKIIDYSENLTIYQSHFRKHRNKRVQTEIQFSYFHIWGCLFFIRSHYCCGVLATGDHFIHSFLHAFTPYIYILKHVICFRLHKNLHRFKFSILFVGGVNGSLNLHYFMLFLCIGKRDVPSEGLRFNSKVYPLLAKVITVLSSPLTDVLTCLSLKCVM